MVEDRARSLRGLGVRDRGADHGLEHLVSETLLQRGERLARVHGAHVGEVQQHAEQRQPGVEVLAREIDHLHRLLDPLQGEVLGLGRDQRVVGGDERVDRQQAERGRAVDQDQLVLLAGPSQRLSQRQLAAHPAAQHQLGLGKGEVGRDDVLEDRLVDRGATREHVGDRRLCVRRKIEVVGEVALRVEVDRERPQPGTAQDVGERAHGGGLARPALLRENRDRLRHGRRYYAAAGDVEARPPALATAAGRPRLSRPRRSSPPRPSRRAGTSATASRRAGSSAGSARR